MQLRCDLAGGPRRTDALGGTDRARSVPYCGRHCLPKLPINPQPTHWRPCRAASASQSSPSPVMPLVSSRPTATQRPAVVAKDNRVHFACTVIICYLSRSTPLSLSSINAQTPLIVGEGSLPINVAAFNARSHNMAETAASMFSRPPVDLQRISLLSSPHFGSIGEVERGIDEDHPLAKQLLSVT